MKKLFFVLLVVLLSVPSSLRAAVPCEELIRALIQVESKGDDNAIGDKHLANRAYGCLQIRQPCVDDVNRKLGTSYRAEEMLGNRDLSILVCKTYIDMYATEKRLGQPPTLEDMARIWNGGPNGWKKSSTVPYWEKVRETLQG